MTKIIKLAIIGYGKMGKEIEKFAPQSGCKAEVVIDNEQDWEKYGPKLSQLVDVAVEFTSPGVVVQNLKKLIDLKIPVVTGTTGWGKDLPAIEKYCRESNGSVFYASNFSIGVNLFFALNRYLANLMADYPTYRPLLEETHHTQKLDAPSGTAVTMLEDIMRVNPAIKGWKLEDDNPAQEEVSVIAHRIENVTGTHKLVYNSDIDTISIEHAAHNREGFAKGALLAARWLKDKKGVYTMNDLLKL